MQLIRHVLSRKKTNKKKQPAPPPPSKKNKKKKRGTSMQPGEKDKIQTSPSYSFIVHICQSHAACTGIMPMILSACGYQNSNLHSTNTSSLTVFPGCIKILTDQGWGWGWGGGVEGGMGEERYSLGSILSPGP